MNEAALVAAGLALLALGGEGLVRGAVSAARRFGVSPLLIGLTLVGFGTSTPELSTSMLAALEGSPGLAVGNVIGSNTANILLILGVAALLRPLPVSPPAFRRDGVMLLVSSLACLAAAVAGSLDRWAGGALLLGLVGYLVWAYRNERATADEEAVMHESVAADAPAGPPSLPAACALALGGVAAVVLGAWLLVEGAIGLARGWGISETAIGLTVVAVGTSLPELVASAVAALRGHAAVALGNVIGSNIFNALGILGATAALTPLAIPPEILAFDIWVLLGATALLTLFVRTGWTVRRWEGAVFVGLYALYVGLII